MLTKPPVPDDLCVGVYQFHIYYCYLLGLGSFAALLIEALLMVAAVQVGMYTNGCGSSSWVDTGDRHPERVCCSRGKLAECP